MTLNSSLIRSYARLLVLVLALLSLNAAASAASISFGIDPFEGTNVKNTPGRQVVGGEFFISFFTATDSFLFNGAAFGMSELNFASGAAGAIPFNANVVVLQTLDNDNNPLTPFGAGNAADLIAAQVTVHGPGVFLYFNSSLNLVRLVYSTDLASNQADLRILARLLNFNGQTGVNGLATFSAGNFALDTGVPEPATVLTMSGGFALLALGAVRRRRKSAAQR